jgi:hypothetical protein
MGGYLRIIHGFGDIAVQKIYQRAAAGLVKGWSFEIEKKNST